MKSEFTYRTPKGYNCYYKNAIKLIKDIHKLKDKYKNILDKTNNNVLGEQLSVLREIVFITKDSSWYLNNYNNEIFRRKDIEVELFNENEIINESDCNEYDKIEISIDREMEIGNYLKGLKIVEKHILEMYYLKEMTLAEIGEIKKLSIERVRQLKESGIKRIRKQNKLNILRPNRGF